MSSDFDVTPAPSQPVPGINVYDQTRGVLGDAARTNSTRAGNRAKTQGGAWPPTNKIQVGDFIFLLTPVEAIPFDRGVIDLQAEAHAAAVVTLVVSPVEDATEIPAVAGRDFFCRIEFGTANGTQRVDVDVLEGTAIRLPTASINAQFFDQTPRPSLNGDPAPPYHVARVSASVAYSTTAQPGQRTQRCWLPIWLAQPQNQPPDIAALIAALA